MALRPCCQAIVENREGLSSIRMGSKAAGFKGYPDGRGWASQMSLFLSALFLYRKVLCPVNL